MNQLKMKQVSENPFYKQVDLLALWQNGSTGKLDKNSLFRLLDAAWKAVKEYKLMREMFFIIVFSFGDIENRHHNILKFMKKVDNGGNSHRETFMWCMEWMRVNTQKQYYTFLMKDLFRQFTSLFSILTSRVNTEKGKKTIKKVTNTLKEHDLNFLSDYIVALINGNNPVEKTLIAKALVRPRLSKRQKTNRQGEKVSGGRKLQDQTIENMKWREKLYVLISNKMSWGYAEYPGNILFTGMNEWKKQFTGELESVLFSSGKVVEFDHDQFFKWLSSLPAGARYRVRRRLLDGDNKSKGKWFSNFNHADLAVWFLEWENYKEVVQKEERILTEKVRQGTASEEDKIKLVQVKKEAKVTTGGASLFETLTKLVTGDMKAQEADLLIQSVMNKIIFEVPILTICDISGSMTGTPTRTASLLTTIAMLKNPSEDLDNYLVVFDNTARFLTDNSKGTLRQNKYMQGKETIVNRLVDRTKTFSENLMNISALLRPSGGTNIDSIGKGFKAWVDSAATDSERSMRIESIRQYPVFVIISDGDFNNSNNPKASILKFKRDMLQWFGWDGVIVVWDVYSGTNPKSKFDDVDNVMHYFGWNAGAVSNIFTKLHDLDIIDVYTPLNSLYQNNRYDIVKQFTI